MARAQVRPSGAAGNILAITGAIGGIGATSLGIFLARMLAQEGLSVALLDTDISAGASLYLGHELGRGLTWSDIPPGELEIRTERLADSLPEWMGVRVLSGDGRAGPADHSQVAVMSRALAAHHDVVLVDLQRGSPVPEGATALVLSTLTLPSVLATRMVASRLLDQGCLQVQLAVRTLGEDVDESELANFSGCEVVGRFNNDRSIAQRAARGEDITRGRGAARKGVRALAEELLVTTLVGLPRVDEGGW